MKIGCRHWPLGGCTELKNTLLQYAGERYSFESQYQWPEPFQKKTEVENYLWPSPESNGESLHDAPQITHSEQMQTAPPPGLLYLNAQASYILDLEGVGLNE
jgi:hypothetical protein